MAEKKNKDTSGFAPNWRPDFRVNDVLPDVKAVRTNFLVNFVALALAIIVTGWFAYREFQGMSAQSQIETLQDQIQAKSKENRANLKLSSEFKKASPQAEDLITFYKGYEYPLDVILALSESRPKTIALQSLRLGSYSKNVGTARKPKLVYMPRYTLRVVLKGSNEESLEELSKYKSILSNLDIIKDRLNSIDEDRPTFKEELGLFEFTIVINLKEAS
ncbi:hypothetical protein [Cerasicoccus maritimus]|uniref:hypothetical protein n=1 Tax=Cerasicoccus maritimus TaxID=490089 RepID=UPI00285290AB|nr:hypothetical protein [Cerasicoccus maritimus]